MFIYLFISYFVQCHEAYRQIRKILRLQSIQIYFDNWILCMAKSNSSPSLEIEPLSPWSIKNSPQSTFLISVPPWEPVDCILCTNRSNLRKSLVICVTQLAGGFLIKVLQYFKVMFLTFWIHPRVRNCKILIGLRRHVFMNRIFRLGQ